MSILATEEENQQNQPAPTPAPAPLPPSGPASDLSDSLLENAPTPSPGFVARLKGEGAKKIRVSSAALVDKEGFIYDRRFCVLGHGNRPGKTKTGLWEMRKNPQTGARFVRSEVLKKQGAALSPDEPPQQSAPRPKLNLPGDDSQGSATGAGVTDEQPGQTQLTPARQLAIILDGSFWGAAHLYADSDVVVKTQQALSPAGVEAMAAGLSTFENLVELPWWVGAAAIYGPAAAAMAMHEKSKPKRTSLMEKIRNGWAWLKGYNSGKAAA